MSHEPKAAVTKPAILHAARETIILLRPQVPSIHKYIGITWIDRGAALLLRVDLSCKRRNDIRFFFFKFLLLTILYLHIYPRICRIIPL